jgi:aspartyl-tRNA(Asn)/glutamyl-tRNA(Gln) amidotransferase subunit C
MCERCDAQAQPSSFLARLRADCYSVGNKYPERFSMSVTADDVRRIARLARIAEPTDRVEILVGELNGILDWIEQLNEVDVEGVEPMTTPVKFALPQRTDEITDGNVRDKVLANAPKSEEGFFVVPKAVE